MRLLIVNRRYCPGEAWTSRVLAYAKGFAEWGAEVKLCFLIGDRNRSRYEVDIPGVEVVDFWLQDGPLARKNRYVSLLENLYRCKRYIQPTDCVFVYGVEPYIAKMALKKTRHVYGEISEHPFMSGSNERKALPKSRAKLLNRLQGLFVISHSLKAYFVENGIDKQKVHISNMFVDTDRFGANRQSSSEKYFAYCGIVSKYKDGVDTLLKAFCAFHQSYPDYKLYVIGRFESPRIQRELEHLAASLFIENHVVFTGQVLPEKMPALLSNAQALVLARPNNVQSKYGFPTKLGEYLATGNPVIVTDVGEIGTFLKDRDNAVVIPPDDVNSFAFGLSWVVTHPDEAARIGERGRELAQTAFSYKTQSEKVLNIMKRTSDNL